MKRLLVISSLLLALSLQAALPFTNTATFKFTMIVDTNSLGGLSTVDYSTNFSAVFVTTTNITTPTNQWSVSLVLPVSQVLSQGPPGTVWSWQFPIDSATRFFMLQYTNTSNGGVGPFCQPCPLIWTIPSGSVGAAKQ